MAETTWLDATAHAYLVCRGEVSPKELAEAAIAAIEADLAKAEAAGETKKAASLRENLESRQAFLDIAQRTASVFS